MRVDVYGWTPSEFEAMAIAKINAKLKHERKGILKTFKVGSIAVTTPQEANAYQAEIERCYEVNGFMSLGDETAGRAFRFLVEKGLSWREATELADQLASQVDKCADRMLSDRKHGRENYAMLGATA
jgi:hypothetical protein